MPVTAPLVLRARSLDRHARQGLRPSARLTAHSLFQRALNLVDSRGQVYGLVGPSVGNGPGLLVLEALPPGGFATLGLPAAAPFWVEAGDLLVGSGLRVEFGSAALWQAPRPIKLLPARAVGANLALAVKLALEGAGEVGLGPLLVHRARWLSLSLPPDTLSPLLRAAWGTLVDLRAGWRAADAHTLRGAAERLIGLGPGQTPSGDDLLAGLLVATGRLRLAPPSHAALVDAVLAAAPGRTTDLGLARLRYAALGDLDERAEAVLTALLAEGPSRVAGATRHLLAFGHSSGLDTLVGLVLGLDLALQEHALGCADDR